MDPWTWHRYQPDGQEWLPQMLPDGGFIKMSACQIGPAKTVLLLFRNTF